MKCKEQIIIIINIIIFINILIIMSNASNCSKIYFYKIADAIPQPHAPLKKEKEA